jgi:hypothetical protein
MKCRVRTQKPNISKNRIIENIKEVVNANGYCVEIGDIIVSLYTYMVSHNLFGGCHALSSVLYVALREMGFNPILLIGECQLQGQKPFDHSWLSMDNKIIDLAIFMPLTQIVNSVSGPVVFDEDVITLRKTNLQYGINTHLPLSADTNNVINLPFCDYMDYFPNETEGLWTVLKNIMPPSYVFNLYDLKEKYKTTTRQFVR